MTQVKTRSSVEEKLNIIKLGANAQGSALIGDGFIGYKFIDGKPFAANFLLEGIYKLCSKSGKTERFNEWCFQNRDEDHSGERWGE